MSRLSSCPPLLTCGPCKPRGRNSRKGDPSSRHDMSRYAACTPRPLQAVAYGCSSPVERVTAVRSLRTFYMAAATIYTPLPLIMVPPAPCYGPTHTSMHPQPPARIWPASRQATACALPGWRAGRTARLEHLLGLTWAILRIHP